MVRFIMMGGGGMRLGARLLAIITPTGRRQPLRATSQVGSLIGTVCGMVRQFDPLRIVWHAAGRPRYRLNLGNGRAIAPHR